MSAAARMRVLIADEMSPRAAEVLAEAGFAVDVRTGLPAAELARVVGAYHALGVRSATKVTAAVLAESGLLRIVGRAGVGIDNIDVPAATARNIVVVNTPMGNAVAAAELAIGHLFALARRIPQAARTMRDGRWDKKRFVGVELTGKTLGVLGLGHIGRAAAERGLGLRMNVIGHDPGLTAEQARAFGVEAVTMDALLARADFLTLHVPLVAATRGLIGAATLAKMKKGACLINCARGGIVDEEALFEALRSGHLGGAAMDVFAHEPPGKLPLLELDNFIATPHLGASTREAQEKVAAEMAEAFVAFLKDGVVRNAVNRT